MPRRPASTSIAWTAAGGGTDRGVRQRSTATTCAASSAVPGGVSASTSSTARRSRGAQVRCSSGSSAARTPPRSSRPPTSHGVRMRRTPRAGQGGPAVGHVAHGPLVDRDRRGERRVVLAVVGHERRGARELDDEGRLGLVRLQGGRHAPQLAHAQAAAAQHAGRRLLPEADQPGDEEHDPLARGGRLGGDERVAPVRDVVRERRRERGGGVGASAAQRQGDRAGQDDVARVAGQEQVAAEQPVDGRGGRGAVGRREADRRTPQQGVQHRARAGGCGAQERRQVVEVDRLRGGAAADARVGRREARRVGTEDLGEPGRRLERCVGGVGVRVDEGADDREPQRPLDQRDPGLVGRADRRGEVRRRDRAGVGRAPRRPRAPAARSRRRRRARARGWTGWSRGPRATTGSRATATPGPVGCAGARRARRRSVRAGNR